MASSSPASQHPATPPVAILVLDIAGTVVAANAAAHQLWGVPEGHLAGEAFVRLFAFEVISDEPDWLETQWAAVQAIARDQSAAFVARPHDGDARSVQVRIEQPAGLGDRLLATVQPPPDSARRLPADDTLVPQLAEHGPIGFFDLRPGTGEAWYSPAWKKMLGYVHRELPDTHDSWLERLHPDDTSAAPFLPGKTKAPGLHPFDVEFRLRHRQGHYVWIHCVGVQDVGADGQLRRVFGFHLDISERKEAEEASLANDHRLGVLSGPGPLGAFEFDFASQHFWLSPAWLRLLGHEDGATPEGSAAFLAALPRDEVEAGLENWFMARAPGQSAFLEPVTLQQRNGTPVTLLLGAHRTLNRKRGLVRITGFLCPLPSDRAETAIPGTMPPTLTEEALAALAEGVLLLDATGRILGANETAARLLRLPAAQLTGRALDEVFTLVHREDARPVDPVNLALAADGPRPLSSEHALAAADGTAVPVVWTARPSFDPQCRLRGVVLVFRDPAELSLTPDELVKANRFESLGLLAGGIAHDFNNLLTTILGAISLAKDSRDYSTLADAEQACLAAKGLTKQLLTVAKGGAGARLVVASPALLRDAVQIAAAGSTAVITIEAPESVWPVEVDRPQLLQVFQNLVVNSLQAMPPEPHEARVEIRAVNTPLPAGRITGLPAGDYVEIEVRDNGTGIPPDLLERIFDPFFTTKQHGTGLGLATVLSIVRQHGGQIAVDSAAGAGTAFTVFLPRARQAVETQPRQTPSLRFGTGRVLFMDDDPKIRSLAAGMLQNLDYKFDIAKDGAEAVTLYRRYLNIGRPYDAVILDLTVIGGMGGEECFRQIHDLDPAVRAIAASGYDHDDLARRFLDLGFSGYLTKPYRVTDLGRVIKAVLG